MTRKITIELEFATDITSAKALAELADTVEAIGFCYDQPTLSLSDVTDKPVRFTIHEG